MATAKESNAIVVSGIQPTGNLHLGNYLGAIRHWVKLQNEFPCFFFIADYHSLTEPFDPAKKEEQIVALAAELIALGIDAKRCTLFVQSHVPEVTELCWILNTVTPFAFLERMTQFKDKAARQTSAKGGINAGLFDYPVLQAADVLLYHGSLVPVGGDQIQHVELTRDLARFFNKRFGDYFPEPKPLLTEAPKLMSLTDPEKKMSKSDPGGMLALTDEPQIILQKLKRAVTDTAPEKKERSPGVSNLFLLLEHFGTSDDKLRFGRAHREGTVRYSDLKTLLAERIAEQFSEFRIRRAELLRDPQKLRTILTGGADKARAVARESMSQVRKRIGLLQA